MIDEKQEAVAQIRMAIDNDKLARQNSDALDSEDPPETDEDSDLLDSQNCRLGSREGRRSNLRVLSTELGTEQEEYKGLDERVRDFVTHYMQLEIMRYEDDIHVSLHET
jgi:hypothetical protein